MGPPVGSLLRSSAHTLSSSPASPAERVYMHIERPNSWWGREVSSLAAKQWLTLVLSVVMSTDTWASDRCSGSLCAVCEQGPQKPLPFWSSHTLLCVSDSLPAIYNYWEGSERWVTNPYVRIPGRASPLITREMKVSVRPLHILGLNPRNLCKALPLVSTSQTQTHGRNCLFSLDPRQAQVFIFFLHVC